MCQWTRPSLIQIMLDAWPATSHYLNQCYNIVNSNSRNKLQWNINRNSHIFIQENAHENVVWKIAAILPRSQCVKMRFGRMSYIATAARCQFLEHYNDVIIGAIASQITSLTIVFSTVYSDADQRKHQSSASLAFVRGIHRGPVNSPHKWPVTRKMCPFDDVIMKTRHRCRRHIINCFNMNLTCVIPVSCSVYNNPYLNGW